MILHLATSQSGGAGIAAVRLHTGLRRAGMDSRFLSALGVADSEHRLELLPRQYPGLSARLLAKLGRPLTAQEAWRRTMQSLDTNGVFTSPITGREDLPAHALVRQAAVIHLHWTAGILPWATFFRTATPLVWTLHDMNAFLGMFHYECDRLRAGPRSQEFDLQLREQKRQILQQRSQLTVVCPSRWLSNCAAASPLLGRFRHEVIPYGLDTTIFRPHPQDFSRSVLGLPQGVRLLLFVAERLDDVRKGIDLLIGALSDTDCLTGWECLVVGAGPEPAAGRKCHHTGTISDPRLMALLYNSADLTVIASREDNLPNVVLESLCCGTPVVGTPAGGIPEAIQSGRDGILADAVSVPAVRAALGQAAESVFDRSRIAELAAQRFAESVTAGRYRTVYESVSPEAVP